MKQILIFSVMLSSLLAACSNKHDEALLSYHFKAPALIWEETIPLGNGRIGLMPDGGIDKETFVLNEISMWSGSKQETDNPDAQKSLPEIRRLLFEGKNHEAQELMYKTFVCKGKGSGHGVGANAPYGSYQLLGNLNINYIYDNRKDTSLYYRELVLDNAIACSSFWKGDTIYLREAFTSFASDIAVIHLKANKKGIDKKATLAFSVGMNRPERAQISIAGKDLTMSGQLNDGYNGDDGLRFGAQVRIVLPEGGNLTVSGDTALVVNGASEAILLVAMATDYFGKDVNEQLDAALSSAENKNIETLRTEHIAAYQKLFSRVKIDLGHRPERERMSINKRLEAFQKDKNDPSLMVLYYQFGRYLLISSTRPGLLPPNLQGLWCNTINTPWNGDYHLNINLQMNLWIAETGNLHELFLPFSEWTKNQVESGRRTARSFYGARGWVTHILGNVWEFTAPGEHPSWGATNTSAAWLCNQLFDHYRFTNDTAYLKEIYPVIRESALFFVDMLVEDPRSNYLVTAPTTSPENTYLMPDGKGVNVCAGSTMDNQIIRELFDNCVTAAKTILKTDSDFVSVAEEKRNRLMPTATGEDGRVMEWLEPYRENDPHHRHVSHLYGLYPGFDSFFATQEGRDAARKTLEARGDESTGWSMAWKACFWARLRDGDHAFKLLSDLLKPCVMNEGIRMSGGGTYPNLFCAHPPFQIDGNFGGAAAIAEMLVRSDEENNINFLPALPKEWKSGSFEGLRVRGGGTVSAKWKNGVLVSSSIKKN